MLMLDHIDQAAGAVRAHIVGLSDEQLLAARERGQGQIVADPFRSYALRQAGLVEHSAAAKMLRALWPHNLRDIVAGELPVPEGRVMGCPHYGNRCTSNAGALFTFDELREHLPRCTAAGRAAGIALDDPFNPQPYDDRNHPTWRWQRSEVGDAIVAMRPSALVSVAHLRLARSGAQVPLFSGGHV
jgi:hypothetical protein